MPDSKRQPELALGLTNAGKYTGPHVATRGQHPADFTPAHQVKRRAKV